MQRFTRGSALAALALALVVSATQQDGSRPPAGEPPAVNDLGGDLVKGLLATDGCLGVETAFTASKKTVIFAWFKDVDATLDWYYSDAHQGAMNMFMTGDEGGNVHEEPLMYLHEHEGPLLCVASITPTADGAKKVDGMTLPIEQIAIELYAPLPGGVASGGRFSPKALKVPHLLEFSMTGETLGPDK